MALTMRSDNDGVTVKINLWSLKPYLHKLDSRRAKLAIEGQVTNSDQEKAIFHGPGELLSILGKWNAKKFRELRREARAKAKRERV